MFTYTKRDAHHINTVTLPAYWASALVNGDYSGLDDAEAARCEAAEAKLAEDGWSVVSTADDDEPRFTWSYKLYDPEADCSGGEVLDYTVLKAVADVKTETVNA